MINDFTAQAYAQINPSLEPHRTLTTPQPKTGQSLLVIGPGTGLGISALVSTIAGPSHQWRGRTCEFSPADEMESELLAFMRRRHDQPSAEHLVSGPGLENIHLFLTSRDGQGNLPSVAEIGAGTGSDSAQPLLANLPASICQDEVAGLRGAQQARFSRHLDQYRVCALRIGPRLILALRITYHQGYTVAKYGL